MKKEKTAKTKEELIVRRLKEILPKVTIDFYKYPYNENRELYSFLTTGKIDIESDVTKLITYAYYYASKINP